MKHSIFFETDLNNYHYRYKKIYKLNFIFFKKLLNRKLIFYKRKRNIFFIISLLFIIKYMKKKLKINK